MTEELAAEIRLFLCFLKDGHELKQHGQWSWISHAQKDACVVTGPQGGDG